MDHRRQLLQALMVRQFRMMTVESRGYIAIQVRRSQLHGMRGHDTGVQAIEPTRIPVVPRAVLDDGVVSNAVTPCLGERAVRDLVHSYRARCGLVDVERPWRPGPAPIGLRHGIAGTLHLRECREQFRGNDIRGVLLEQRPISAPSLCRRLIERTADWKKELRRFTNDLVDPIEREPQTDGDRQHNHKLPTFGCPLERTQRAPSHATTWPEQPHVEATARSVSAN